MAVGKRPSGGSPERYTTFRRIFENYDFNDFFIIPLKDRYVFQNYKMLHPDFEKEGQNEDTLGDFFQQ